MRYAVQNRASAFPGEELTFTGTVTGKRAVDGCGLVELSVQGERDGASLLPGTATVSLPLRCHS